MSERINTNIAHPRAVVTEQAVKLLQIGGKGIISGRVPVHRNTSAVMVHNQLTERFYRRQGALEL
jgi:hypothetical protein